MPKKIKMQKNDYTKDASMIFQNISRKIADGQYDNNNIEIIDGVLWFAIGVEKLLKGLLYNINPTYILEKPEYENSAIYLYSDKILNKEGLKADNINVITFTKSLVRVSNFCETILHNKHAFMNLRDLRDTIAHKPIKQLNIDDLRLLLLRDFYPLLKSLSDSMNIGGDLYFFNNLNAKLAQISSSLETDIAKALKIRIDGILKDWNTKKKAPGQSELKFKQKTLSLLSDDYTYPCKCPCCKNYAVVYTKPIYEFNPIEKKLMVVSVETQKLICGYCGFDTNKYNELDYLKIQPEIEKKDDIVARLKSDESFMS